MKNIVVNPWALNGFDMKKPIIIAGPCSAETEQQTLTTARMLAANGVKLFRAGIWKPRTRPGAFEGVGTTGLPWLQKVKKETGMFVGTEVATPQHVYEALKFGLDLIWVGARTTANPFAVQEIADALKGVDMPVLIKNPVNPDINLWIGAIERISRAGVTQLAAIHRGFSTYTPSEYRNHPQWMIPMELRRRMPQIPIITDPSHITGKRSMIQEVSQQAMDLNFDGLIIETHCKPDDAWSDAEQQVHPDELHRILSAITYRNANIVNVPRTRLDDLRLRIDEIDNQLIELLSARMEISRQIGLYKHENNITILQSRRYNEVINTRNEKAERKGLNGEFVSKVFESIHEESVLQQSMIMNKNQNQTQKA